ncbi:MULTISPECIES: DUF2690 domain-containing protein [Streptomyces]|uniref:YjfA family protein n=1 Tax=Streptomyces spinosisporus TaxID=2927582 RepID=A0ABS9XKF4_9ACTN|nr:MULTISPECIES: DUF2690 domain-containing protein [Streptomyces]EPD63204.1 hypothetical protein HMPREF1211_03545 [Streptomyces sp. HGB0020]MCI3242567.1 YjfA family protein [Streptomyces spinosisporus]WUB40345.1 YjfA family protein [Streptomyces sp. NBC_00588]
MRRRAPGSGSRLRLLRTLSSAALTVALAAACVFTGSTAASAAGCKGAACTGQSPATMGCDDDARLLEEIDDTSMSLKFYYSGTCDASWAYVTVDPQSSIYPQAANIFYVPQLGGSEASYSAGYVNQDDVAKATPMVGGNAMAKGCATDIGPGFDPAPETWKQEGTTGVCTQWH